MNNLFGWIYPIISIYISIFLWLKTTFSPLDSGSCTSNKTKHLCQAGDAVMRAFKLLLFGCLSDHQRGGDTGVTKKWQSSQGEKGGNTLDLKIFINVPGKKMMTSPDCDLYIHGNKT